MAASVATPSPLIWATAVASPITRIVTLKERELTTDRHDSEPLGSIADLSHGQAIVDERVGVELMNVVPKRGIVASHGRNNGFPTYRPTLILDLIIGKASQSYLQRFVTTTHDEYGGLFGNGEALITGGGIFAEGRAAELSYAMPTTLMSTAAGVGKNLSSSQCHRRSRRSPAGAWPLALCVLVASWMQWAIASFGVGRRWKSSIVRTWVRWSVSQRPDSQAAGCSGPFCSRV